MKNKFSVHFVSVLFGCMLLFHTSQAYAQIAISSLDGEFYPKEGQKVTFMAHVAAQNESAIRYSWDFGDGTAPVSGVSKSVVPHVYRDQGDFELVLTVRSEDGFTDTFTKSVQAKNVDPKVKKVRIPEVAKISEPLRFQVIGIDPGDDDLTYTWTFSDGDDPQEGENLSKIRKHFREKGIHTVKLKVTDEDGGEVNETYRVSVGVEYAVRVTGNTNVSNTGGAYFQYLATGEEVNQCVASITLYNDTDRSIVQINWQDNYPLLEREKTHMAFATMYYGMPDAVYFQFKGLFGVTNASADPDFLEDYMEGFRRAPGSVVRLGIEAGSAAFTEMGRKLKSVVDRIPFFGKKKKKGPGSSPREPGTFGKEWAMEGLQPILQINESRNGRFIGSFDFSGSSMDDGFASISGEFNMDITSLHQAYIEDGCEEEVDEFAVIEVSPEAEQKNVNHREPEIIVQFSADVNRETVDESTIELSYRDAEGEEVIIPADYEFRTNSTVVLHPQADSLKSGIIYLGSVIGGEFGIQGAEGEELEDNFQWIFSTIVVPDSVVVDLYQVSRNAPLVTKKATAARVYAYWTEDETVDSDSQVTEFVADVELPPFAAVTKKFTRPDQITDEERRHGLDSINFYNWRPSSKSKSSIEVTVRPTDQEDDVIEFKSTRDIDYFELEGEALDVDYYTMRVGPWALNEVPSEAKASIHLAANRSALYTTQNFPVSRTRIRDRGEISFIGSRIDDFMIQATGIPVDMFLDLFKAVNGVLPWPPSSAARAALKSEQFESLLLAFLNKSNSSADIIVGFFPESVVGTGGGARYADPYFNGPTSTDTSFNRRVAAMTSTWYTYSLNALTHEYGHLFGLQHLPYATNAAHRKQICDAIGSSKTWEGIHGMRMSKNGRSAAFKSSEYGNSESASFLLPLMFPCAKLMAQSFITDDQYLSLQASMRISRQNGTYSSLMPKTRIDLGPRVGINSGYPSYRGQKTISTALVLNGDQSWLLPFSDSNKPLPLSLYGEFRVELLDETGKVLSTSYHQRKEVSDDQSYVTFTLPWGDEVKSIRVDGPKVNREFTRDGFQTRSDLTAECDENTCDLSWTIEKESQTVPIYSVYYRPNTEEEWRILAGLWFQESFSTDIGNLEHGDQPQFKLETAVGLETTSTVQDVAIKWSQMEVSYVWPSAEDSLAIHDEIEVGFDNQPSSSSITLENVLLTDSNGDLVDVFIFDQGDDRMISIVPKEPLEYDRSYTLELKKEIVSSLGLGLKDDYKITFQTLPSSFEH